MECEFVYGVFCPAAEDIAVGEGGLVDAQEFAVDGDGLKEEAVEKAVDVELVCEVYPLGGQVAVEFGDHGVDDVGQEVAFCGVVVVEEGVGHVAGVCHLFGGDVFVAFFQKELISRFDEGDPLG